MAFYSQNSSIKVEQRDNFEMDSRTTVGFLSLVKYLSLLIIHQFEGKLIVKILSGVHFIPLLQCLSPIFTPFLRLSLFLFSTIRNSVEGTNVSRQNSFHLIERGFSVFSVLGLLLLLLPPRTCTLFQMAIIHELSIE